MRENLIRLLWIALCVVLQGPVTFRVAMAGLEVPLATIEEQAPAFDVVVYGATSAGVVAAVQARRLGKSVVIVGPDRHLGGLSSGGLGFTDTGNKAVIGGLSREFYQRIWQHYDRAEAWRWQKREEYGNKGQGTPAIDGAQRTMWIFEPHVAEQVFEDLVAEHRIPVHRDEWLDRASGVVKNGPRIVSIRMLSGRTFTGRVFIDATYEGDLMASAGVDYHVGRESQAAYGEKWNGVQTGVLHHRHHFGVLKPPISPYVVPGEAKSGVLPRVSAAPPGDYGAADKRIQAYCYRYCVTDHPDNRTPFAKPEGYDPKQYELLLRIYEAGWRETFDKFDPVPNRKTDSNNHGPFSTDNIGMNYDYPEASYERRRQILKEHESYQKGWLYFIANDPRVPADVRERMQQWGLPKDEFKDNGGWPHQIYVREARRMIGSFVMTENELMRRKPTPDSVGMGSYTIDSHNVQRYITPEGAVQNEGDIGVPLPGPYEIAYGSLVPKRGQASNLIVPVCVSSSHIAFGSIRMEPVFMVLAHSAATAAVMAIDGNLAVQDVPYAELRARLVKEGQVLEYAGK
jgi:FAD dependent oxidoreductase